MPDQVPAELRDSKTPADVVITLQARKPQMDPTCGVALPRADTAVAARHRLVTLGDSMTHGFQSFAIHNTDYSYPAIIAHELGWLDSFRRPAYPGFGGLPLNLEWLIRGMERSHGDKIRWWDFIGAGVTLQGLMDQVEDYWERGEGSTPPPRAGIMHNLGVWGWDLRDTLVRTAKTCEDEIKAQPSRDNFIRQLVDNSNARSALRVLDSARDAAGTALTPLEAAAALGEDGEIETLVVMLGANNALGAVAYLRVKWSEAGYTDLALKKQYTVSTPTHFAAELALVVEAVKKIRARHVIWGTVPHVTIAPLARGVGESKSRPGSRYFDHYTYVWIGDEDFDEGQPQITAAEARAVDCAIDQYNDAITAAVTTARLEGRDWYLLDVAGLLDRLAQRRYIEDRTAQPDWWDAVGGQYRLPPALDALRPPITSQFFHAGPGGRTQGGLFSLDGVHTTTIGYGILAQELITIMEAAGVKFYTPAGVQRPGPVTVDFQRLLGADTLVSDPPHSITSDLELIGWLDEKIGFSRLLVKRDNV